MITVILLFAAVAAAVGWFATWVSLKAFISYAFDNGCPAPSREELRWYIGEVTDEISGKKKR